MGSLKGGLGLIWGGLISGGLRVFKGKGGVWGWFRLGFTGFRVGSSSASSLSSWLVQGGLMVGLKLLWSGSGLVRVGLGLA